MKAFIIVLCFLTTIFSYTLVDINFPLKVPNFLYNFSRLQKSWTTLIFLFLISLFFAFYFILLKKVKDKKLGKKQIWQLILLITLILFFSFPGLSHDIFNYMATARVTFFYQENPYLIMPMEFINEPMLKFMHAANKTALYAPFWILLTVIPHFLSFGNIILGVFTFKAFVILFYLLTCWLIWKISKNLYSLTFFAFNPLVIIETLVGGHNDVVMMALALGGFWLLLQKKKALSFIPLSLSVGIKYATLPLIILFVFAKRFEKEKFISLSAWLMLIVFLLSPIREEIYSWYFIWVLSFSSLVPQNKLLRRFAFAFSIGLLLRYIPYLYTRRWDGLTPMIKTLTTFIPPGLVLFHQCVKKFR